MATFSHSYDPDRGIDVQRHNPRFGANGGTVQEQRVQVLPPAPYSGGGWTVSVTFLADEPAAEVDAQAFLDSIK